VSTVRREWFVRTLSCSSAPTATRSTKAVPRHSREGNRRMGDSAQRTPKLVGQSVVDPADVDDGAGKADFHAIYNAEDARRFYSTLCGLDYTIPQHGATI